MIKAREEIEYTADGDAYIPIERWGKDHWSTLGYLETRVVDHGGKIVNRNMRCHPRLHRELVGIGFGSEIQDGSAYPTRLKEGVVEKHDDWSCLEDMVAAGLIRAYFWQETDEIFGGSRARVEFTEWGLIVAGQLRTHKASNGTFATFEPVVLVEAAS